MKLLLTSDVHQRYFKWSKLAAAVKKTKPDIVLVAGDIVPHDLFNEPKAFVEKTLTKYGKEIQDAGAKLFFITGNDDNKNIIPFIEQIEKESGLWYFVNDKVVEYNGYEFVGIPYTLDYPFLLKDWIVRESSSESRYSDAQFGQAIIVGENNKRIPIANWRDTLMARPTFEEIFEKMALKVKNMNKSVWLIHDPPYGCGLDMTSRGLTVGSKSVMKFILDKQPFLTVHGHIHESPEYTGKWAKHIGDTWVVQAGQVENDLYYAIVDIMDDKIVKVEHSIFGDYHE